eukprot:GHRQ01004559.1.p1 GENE.GHRQ01004559.1~~GHRQ01004559.1.p1  ORF type:complete len:162 (+),score=13.34 GHRQ01004559.1:261-746(+)
MQLGSVQQWNFNDAFFHPLHVHVNPFQLVAVNSSLLYPGNHAFSSNFYKMGDYYDTLVFPFYTPDTGALTLRFQPGKWTGYTVMHRSQLAETAHFCRPTSHACRAVDRQPWRHSLCSLCMHLNRPDYRQQLYIMLASCSELDLALLHESTFGPAHELFQAT